MRSAVTVCLVPEAHAGPFVFHGDLEVACAQSKKLGFDAIELFPPDADALDDRVFRQMLHRSCLELAAVGTGAGWVVHKLSLTSPDSGVRRRALNFVASIIDFAGRYGAPAIIGSMQGRAEGSVTRDHALNWLGEALEHLGPLALGHGVPLLLEPLNRYESNLLNTVEQATEFLATVRNRNLRLLCDLFHMNIEEASIPNALVAAGPLLGHVHFADSNRQAVGLGHTDVEPAIVVLQNLGYSGYLSAEVLPLPTAVDAATRTLESFRKYVPAPSS